MKDYHAILGLSKNASEEDIKKAYRKLAMKYHPDRHQGAGAAEAEAKFKDIKEAYERLTSPQPAAQGGMSFEDVFSQAFAFGGGHPGGPQWQGVMRRFIAVSISIEMALNGGKQKFIINTGGGRAEHTVDIPAGIGDGEPLLVLQNQSEEIIVQARIDAGCNINWGANEPHKRGDAQREEHVTPFKMIMGGWHEARTLDGSIVSIRIPPGLKSGSYLKIQGKGYWRDRNLFSRGDMYLKIIPDIKKIEQYTEAELTSFKEFLNSRGA